MTDPIDLRISTFKTDLKNTSLSNEELVRRYVSFGTPFIFSDDESLYFDLKNVIAQHFRVSHSHVIMVGSAKLGFSVAPKKLWRKLNDESDIDMVIISDQLFCDFWKDLLEFNVALTSRTEAEDNKYSGFLEYFFKGWLRPDLFPFKYENKNRWLQFFEASLMANMLSAKSRVLFIKKNTFSKDTT